MYSLPDSYQNALPLLQKYYSLESIAREPWSNETTLYIPTQHQLMLENGGAESFAAIIYLNSLNLKYEIKIAKNVAEMSPSGKGPLLKCGRFSIGEYEAIVNFCNIKVKIF